MLLGWNLKVNVSMLKSFYAKLKQKITPNDKNIYL